MATNRIIVFGGGTVLGEDGRVCLHETSTQRAERTIEYFNTHKALFGEGAGTNKPFILCTGGYGLLSAGIEGRDPNDREAVIMANYLVTKGNIPKEIILLEQESTSTLTNWTKSIKLFKDKLDARLFNQTNPLGLISHPHHLKRVVYLAVQLGYDRAKLELIPTTQVDNENYERHVLAAYKEYLSGVSNPQAMEAKERDLAGDASLMTYLRSLQ